MLLLSYFCFSSTLDFNIEELLFAAFTAVYVHFIWELLSIFCVTKTAYCTSYGCVTILIYRTLSNCITFSANNNTSDVQLRNIQSV